MSMPKVRLQTRRFESPDEVITEIDRVQKLYDLAAYCGSLGNTQAAQTRHRNRLARLRETLSRLQTLPLPGMLATAGEPLAPLPKT